MDSIILTYEGFQDQEVVYPYYRLMEEIGDDGNVYLFSNKLGRIHGILGCHVPSNRLLEELNEDSVRQSLFESCSLFNCFKFST